MDATVTLTGVRGLDVRETGRSRADDPEEARSRRAARGSERTPEHAGDGRDASLPAGSNTIAESPRVVLALLEADRGTETGVTVETDPRFATAVRGSAADVERLLKDAEGSIGALGVFRTVLHETIARFGQPAPGSDGALARQIEKLEEFLNFRRGALSRQSRGEEAVASRLSAQVDSLASITQRFQAF